MKSKNIMITGANSYIGTSVENWIRKYSDCEVSVISLVGVDPKNVDFTNTDVVFHVAGIAHRKETKENAHEYYEINRNLAVNTARAAKKAGVKQFVILSSMGVYGLSTGKISDNTEEHPVNHYARAKYQADRKLLKMNSDTFKVCIVRPPMVYGKECKGNYQSLRKFALKVPFFPSYPNKRSMIHIDNLANIIMHLILTEAEGVYRPQDSDYINTCDMVCKIAEKHSKKKLTFSFANPIIKYLMPHFSVLQKVFGSIISEKDTKIPDEWIVRKGLKETISVTEK